MGFRIKLCTPCFDANAMIRRRPGPESVRFSERRLQATLPGHDSVREDRASKRYPAPDLAQRTAFFAALEPKCIGLRVLEATFWLMALRQTLLWPICATLLGMGKLGKPRKTDLEDATEQLDSN